MQMKILNFYPKNQCFSKALIKWKDLALNGLLASGKPIVDLSQEDITELLLDLFGPLSFIEICLLHWASKEHPNLFESVDWMLFFQKQNFQFNSRNLELSAKLKAMPHDFLIWSQKHQMSPRDLMPINSLDNPDCLKGLVKNFPDLKLTRNEGKKILDILVDLILMGEKTGELAPSSDNWFQQLAVKRYPKSLKTNSSPEKEEQWPAYVHIKRSRQGDRVVHKLQLTYNDQRDLNSKLERLYQMTNHV